MTLAVRRSSRELLPLQNDATLAPRPLRARLAPLWKSWAAFPLLHDESPFLLLSEVGLKAGHVDLQKPEKLQSEAYLK